MRRAALFLFAAGLFLQAQIPHYGKRRPDAADDKALTFSFAGVIRQMDDKSMDLEAVDTRFINFLIAADSKFPKDLKVGDPVRVDATQDDKGIYHAIGAKLDETILKAMPKESPAMAPTPTIAADEPKREREQPATILVKDTPRYDAGDQGPPALKHGKPPQRANQSDAAGLSPEDSTDSKVAARNEAIVLDTPARTEVNLTEPGMDLIERARDAAASFLNGLPNYVCTQVTTRYQSETKNPNWQALDNISADLVYEDGKESYRNLQINNKPTKKSPEETGAWSYGEFGTILEDVYTPASAAEFHFLHDGTTNRLKSSTYDFKVDRPHSHWKIAVQSQFVLPAYEGEVVIEKETARTLRILMQAKQIPKQFPEDVIETTVDYEYILLGTDKFLLPVHAELLSCERGSYRCQKNTIDFRNYHRFTGESTVKFSQ